MKKTKNQEYQDFNEIIDESKRDLTDYVDKRLTIFKLKSYEKVSNFSSRLLYGLIILLFVLVISLLLLITCGLYLGYLLNNYPAGFGVLALVCIFIMALIIFNRRRVRGLFVDLTLRTIKKIEEDED